MSEIVLKLAGKYLVWGSIVDAPLTYGMTLEELIDYWRLEHGRQGFIDLERRLPDVDGPRACSALGWTADQIISTNRAGPNGTTLTKDELIARYVTTKKGKEP